MKQKCLVCGVNADSAYCFRHKPRKAIPKKITRWGITFNNMRQFSHKITDGRPPDANGVKEWVRMHEFFMLIWKTRHHVSGVSGTYLGEEPLTVYFHHILPKNDKKYPQAKYDAENIILLTLDEHSSVELDMYKYPEINKRRERLIVKYGII